MSFEKRFLDAEALFLTALTSGPPALAQFDAVWEALGTDFERALEQSELGSSEVNVAYTVSSKIAILSENLINLEKTSDEIASDLVAELDTTLSQLSLQDDVGTLRVPTSAFPRKHIGPYIQDAFSWLLKNLHDPYPPSSLKRVWARKANITVRAMDDWCKSIRKEIGWVALTKTHFHGSRSMAVRAATSVLLQGVDDAAVPFEAQTELLAIQTKLESLYMEERGFPIAPTRKRLRSASTSSSITDATPFSRPCSPSTQLKSFSNGSASASSSPCPGDSSRLPSLVLDQSDSEEDERLPEFPTADFLDDGAICVVSMMKDEDPFARRLIRSRHSYYDLSAEDFPSLEPLDSFVQSVSTQAILPPGCDFWSSATLEDVSNTGPPVDTLSEPQLPPTLVSASASRKRRHEDDVEVQVPAPKKARIFRTPLRPDTRKEEAITVPTPIVVADTPHATVEQPIVVDWERLFKDLDQASPQNTDGAVDYNVFDFGGLGPAASTDQVSVSTNAASFVTADDLSSWDKLFSTAAASEATVAMLPLASDDETFQELLANFTHTNTLMNPLSSNPSEIAAISIELSPEFASNFGSAVELPTYSPTSESPQAAKSDILASPRALENVAESRTSAQAKGAPSFLDLLTPFSSGDSPSFELDCLPPSLIAFS